MLYRQPTRPLAQTAWSWAWEGHAPWPRSLALHAQCPSGAVVLALHDWGALAALASLPWDTLPEADRLDLYEQAAQPLLDHLARHCGGPIRCQRLALDEPAADEAFGFALESRVDANASREVIARGWCRLPVIAHAAGAEQDVPSHYPAAFAPARLGTLAAVLAVTLGRCRLSWSELLRVRPGDVLRMEAPPREGQPFRVVLAPAGATDALVSAGAPTWRAVMHLQDNLISVEAFVSTPWHDDGVAPHDATATQAAATPAATADADSGPSDEFAGLGAIPCTLVFEVGRLEVPMAELARVRPGHTFGLAQTVAGVRIVANGRSVGRGELVAIGNEVAVLVRSLELPRDG